jgi:hypothetical protein
MNKFFDSYKRKVYFQTHWFFSDLADYPDDFIDTDDKNTTNQNPNNKESEENNVMVYFMHSYLN